MAWTLFMIFALAVLPVNGDDNTDVVQVTLQQNIDKGLEKMADRFGATPMENWEEEANQMASEIEANVGDRPQHHSNHEKKKHFTKTELKAGREFLDQANHSGLYLEAKKTIHGYMSAATALAAGKNRNESNLTDDELLTYKEPWCKELRLAYGRPICDDAYGYTLSNAWFHTKCLLEACVDGNDTHPPCLGEKGATRLMILVELYDALGKQMVNVNIHLRTAEIIDFEKPEFCPGEEDVFLMKVKQHQNNMLARHHQIQQAMARTRAVAEGLFATASMASNEEHAEDSIQRIWEDICGHLKCDHSSWIDIHDAMHGHVVDLSEEGMPVRTLIEHVNSLRKTHDVLIAAFTKFTVPESENIVHGNTTAHPHAVSLYEMFSKESTGQSGTSRYETLGKDLLAVVDAAYALKHGSTVHLTWYSFCWKVVSGANVVYSLGVKPITGSACKFALGLQFSCGGGVLNIEKVWNAVFNDGPVHGLSQVSCNIKVSFAVACGMDFEIASAGVAIAGSFSLADFSPYKRPYSVNFNSGVVVAASATWDAWPEKQCVVGNWFAGLQCKWQLAAGVGFICMDAVVLPTPDVDAAKDMPMGDTSYGRHCKGSGWGGNSGWNGKSYMWCYTESGGWDYTCPVTDPQLHVSKTTRNENCYKPCAFHGYKYKWCYKDQSDRWDYCCMPGQGSAQTSGQNSRLLGSP
jgi:hypothetical protein